MQIELTHESDAALCRVDGELDASTVVDFREHLAGLVGTRALIIDLCAVPFMDSTGLGALIGGIRKIREGDGAVSVVCDRASVLRLLHTTGFDRIVEVVPTVEEALAVVRAAVEQQLSAGQKERVRPQNR